MWKLQPLLKKVTPSKSLGPVKPSFLKIWLEAQPPPPTPHPPLQEEGVPTINIDSLLYILSS